MENQQPESHLSRILTNPDVLKNPNSFFQVYRVPVHRFFLALCRDSSKADDLFQEFAVKFLSGAFESYTPKKGRFRDYLKTTLRNQVHRLFGDESKRKKRFGGALHEGLATTISEVNISQAFGAFDHYEGKEIRQLVELALKAEEAEGKHHYHSLLSFLLEYQQKKLEDLETADSEPEAGPTKVKVPVHRIAEFLTGLCEKYVTEDNAKKQKSRAVVCYADKIITEISNRIGSTSIDEVRAAANELQLLPYCEKELAKRAKSSRFHSA